MKSLQFYAEAIWRSCFDINWLRERKKDFGRASKYFLGAMLFVSLLFSYVAAREVVTELSQFADRLVSAAPQLAIEYKDGKLVASGVEQPFTLDIGSGEERVFVYLDTTTTSEAMPVKTIREEKREGVNIIITEDKIDIVTQDEQGNFSFSGSEFGNGALLAYGKNAQLISDFFHSNRFFAMVFSVLTVFLFIVMTLLEAVYLAICTGIIALFARSRKIPWTFGELFTVSMFAVTPAVIIGDLLPLAHVDLPFLGTAILLFLLGAVVFAKPKDSSEQLDK